MEEELEAKPSLGLISVTRIVLKTVGEHELHISDEVTCQNHNHQHSQNIRTDSTLGASEHQDH